MLVTCHIMPKKPVWEPPPDEVLRVGMGQEMSLVVLVPTAIGRIESDR